MNRLKRLPITPAIALALACSLSAGFISTSKATAQNISRDGRETARANSEILRVYTRDLTNLASEGKLETAPEAKGIGRLAHVLSKSGKRTPVLISDSDLQRREAIAGLAKSIAA